MEYKFKIDNDKKILEEYAVYLLGDIKELNYSYLTKNNNKYDLHLSLMPSKMELIYDNNKIIFELNEDSLVKSTIYNTCKHQELYMIIFANCLEEAKKILLKYINDALIFSRRYEKDHICVSIYCPKNEILRSSYLKKRNMDTIYLDSKEKIIDDIKNFYKKENLYALHGLLYKRVYLFDGLPGSGKTSLIYAIASLFNKNIVEINFDNEINSASFRKVVDRLLDNDILVLENIDNFLNSIDEKPTSYHGVFNGLLNLLDGVYGQNILIFMTTSDYKKLDTVLKRPGRIDYVLSFNYSTKSNY